jgi:hypothetical protein
MHDAARPILIRTMDPKRGTYFGKYTDDSPPAFEPVACHSAWSTESGMKWTEASA